MRWRLLRWAFLITAVVILHLVLAQRSSASDRNNEPLAIILLGRAIDGKTDQPVADVEVRIHRELAHVDPAEYPDGMRDEVIKSDAQGRFKVLIPGDQVANGSLWMSIHLDHPRYTPVETDRFSPYLLDYRRAYGERPSLRTIRLEARREFTAKVQTPDRQPAEGVPYQISPSLGRSSPMNFLPSVCEGRTDREGMIRTWLKPMDGASIVLTPDDAAHERDEWNFRKATIDSKGGGQVRTKILSPGVRIRGRAIGLDGGPLKDQWIQTTQVNTTFTRRTQTQADGAFEFPPVSEGVYIIHGDRQYAQDFGISYLSLAPTTPILEPITIAARANEETPPVLIHEIQTTVIKVHQRDEQGRAFQGDQLVAYGELPHNPNRIFRNLPSNVFEFDESDLNVQAAAIGRIWMASALPDLEGNLTFRVPIGLTNAGLYMTTRGLPDISCKIRDKTDRSMHPFFAQGFGTVGEAPQEFDLEYSEAPRLTIRLVSPKVAIPQDVSISVSYNPGNGTQGQEIDRLENDTMVCPRLFADVEYSVEVSHRERGVLHESSFKLSSGEVREITVDWDQKTAVESSRESQIDIDEENVP